MQTWPSPALIFPGLSSLLKMTVQLLSLLIFRLTLQSKVWVGALPRLKLGLFEVLSGYKKFTRKLQRQNAFIVKSLAPSWSQKVFVFRSRLTMPWEERHFKCYDLDVLTHLKFCNNYKNKSWKGWLMCHISQYSSLLTALNAFTSHKKCSFLFNSVCG